MKEMLFKIQSSQEEFILHEFFIKNWKERKEGKKERRKGEGWREEWEIEGGREERTERGKKANTY